MARRVFFSFHYDNDSWRAGQVRNSGVVKPNYDETGFFDGVDWETLKRQSDERIKRWIRKQMKGCSVTVVLIGSQTYGREWVDYEINKSVRDDMGLVGVRIHNIKDQKQRTDSIGNNPLKNPNLGKVGETLSHKYHTYDWAHDNGQDNLKDWIEQAARIANR